MFWLVLWFLLQVDKTQHKGPSKSPVIPDPGARGPWEPGGLGGLRARVRAGS